MVLVTRYINDCLLINACCLYYNYTILLNERKGEIEHMYEKYRRLLYKNRHSCFLLSYNLVLVTKYRKPVLTGAVLQTVRDVVLSVMDERGCVFHEINGEADHLHIMFDAGPEVRY